VRIEVISGQQGVSDEVQQQPGGKNGAFPDICENHGIQYTITRPVFICYNYAVNTPLLNVFAYSVTPWTIVGMIGIAMFSLRWLVQLIASARAKKSIIPIYFWYLSAAGSLILIVYFAFGRSDVVGVVSNLLPLCLALCNLVIISRAKQP
jgi:lipid-A-disaccharide synthase-like uncharacterized protein